jgi:hypothetical protein
MGCYSPQLSFGLSKTVSVKVLYFADKAPLVMSFGFDRGCSKEIIKSSSFFHILYEKNPCFIGRALIPTRNTETKEYNYMYLVNMHYGPGVLTCNRNEYQESF